MILNIEVERNAKIKILSQFVDFEPKKGNQIPLDAAISQYWGSIHVWPTGKCTCNLLATTQAINLHEALWSM